jgi:hypothetical protein
MEILLLPDWLLHVTVWLLGVQGKSIRPVVVDDDRCNTTMVHAWRCTRLIPRTKGYGCSHSDVRAKLPNIQPEQISHTLLLPCPSCRTRLPSLIPQGPASLWLKLSSTHHSPSSIKAPDRRELSSPSLKKNPRSHPNPAQKTCLILAGPLRSSACSSLWPQ